jgi:hypothetical protein
MQMKQEKEEKNQGIDVVYFVARSLATTVTPFIRKDFGIEAIGWFGMLGFAILLLMIGITNSPLMKVYFVAWLVILFKQKITTMKLIRQGFEPHSNYAGCPFLAMRLFRCPQENRAKALEIMMVLGIGALICATGEKALGPYLMFASFGLTFTRAIEFQHNLMRARRAKDAQREMEAYEQFMKGNRDY